jgi:hypothetical protein
MAKPHVLNLMLLVMPAECCSRSRTVKEWAVRNQVTFAVVVPVSELFWAP